MRPVVVVFVTPVFGEVREGPATYARYLYDYFSGIEAIDFHVVTIASDRNDPNIHSAGLGRNSLDTYKRLQIHALEVCREVNADVVHGNVAHTMWMFADYPKPVLLQVNDYDQAELWKNAGYLLKSRQLRRFVALAWRRYHERRALEKATLVICNSEYTKRALVENYRIDANKLQTIYKAVDLGHFRRPVQLPADPCEQAAGKQRLVFVGTNWRRKGLDILCRAFVEVLRQNENVFLQVIGPAREELSAELKELIQSGGIENNIRFEGPVTRSMLPACLWYSDLFVLPSRDEALGVSILEALAAGVPVVATRVGGIPEILEGFECGTLIDPNNSRALSDSIVKILADEENRARMAHAVTGCVDRFATRTMLTAVEKVYSELTSGD